MGFMTGRDRGEMSAGMSLGYRPEIDGLRALAVLPVIFFHAGFGAFSGGFVGVDVFFVISGYLITSILLSQLDAGNFSFLDFYLRRVRRILPALFLVLICSIPFAWLLLPPSDLVAFSRSMVAVPLFWANVFFRNDGGYFETAADLKPLLHTWSLAVEEQYYLFFPVLLFFAWKRGRGFVVGLIIFIGLLSLILAQIGSFTRPVANYFLLQSRAWELAIGALVALFLFRRGSQRFSHLTCQIWSFLGFLLVLGSVFFLDKSFPFPGLYALFPTVGAALIIVFSRGSTYVGSLLRVRFLVGLGLLSYSAYLWHQPVISFAKYAGLAPDFFYKTLLVVFVFFVAVLTWRYVERPFRDKELIGSRLVVSLLLFFGAALVVSGYVFSKCDFGGEDRLALELSEQKLIYATNMDERRFIKSRIAYEGNVPDYVVLGSSRIMQVGRHILDEKILNFSVSGASVEDHLAIWWMLKQKYSPKVIFIGADPWLFNNKSNQNRWQALNFEYGMALGELGISRQGYGDAEVEKRDFFLTTVFRELYDSVNVSKGSAVTDDLPGLQDKIRHDGSRIYNSAVAMRSSDEVARDLRRYLEYAMSPFVFSQERADIFEKFLLNIAKSREVILVLSPYHPQLYRLMDSERRQFVEVEHQFRDIALRTGVKIIGSYDPVKVGCDGDEFFDGMHPKDSCMKKVIASISDAS